MRKALKMEAFNEDEEKLLAEEIELEIPRISLDDLVEIEPKWVAMMLAVIDGEAEEASD